MSKPIIHESVANVLDDIGVKRVASTNKPNNSRFVAEGVEAVLAKYRKPTKPVTEEAEGDETDGDNPDTTTTASNKPAGVIAKNDAAKTEVKVEGEMPDFIKDKIEAKKAAKDGEKKDGDKAEDDKGEKKDDKAEDKKDESEKTDEAEKFYANRKSATVFMFFEDAKGNLTAEVHGLNEDELAPYGGKAPAVPPKYAVLAKKDSDFNKGKVGTLALMDVKDPKEGQKILTGGELKAVGWKAPMKGTGKSAQVGGMKDK